MRMKARKMPAMKPAGLKGKHPPQGSHPRFKRPKMSVMGKSAFGTPDMAGGGGAAFPAAPDPSAGLASAGLASAGGAPMPPAAAPDNIAQ